MLESRLSTNKYGETQRAIYAQQNIQIGEIIRYCECAENDGKYTRDQLLELIKNNPCLDYFIRAYSYMIDDDLYKLTSLYKDKIIRDECSYFNHSCDPNCGFDATGHGYVTIKNVEENDELAYHYGFLETEQSLIYGLNCKCGSKNCEGILKFDNYRDDEFVKKYYKYFTPYLKQKVKDMKERWYSKSCYVKRIPITSTHNVEKWKTCLYSDKEIKKNDLVASYLSTDNINEDAHFIRYSENPNCYIKGKNVYASYDIPSETEITIKCS